MPMRNGTVMQMLTLAMSAMFEACLLLHPKCYDVVIDDDAHDGVLLDDGTSGQND